MPSDENNNINLLPHDLQRMRKKIKRSFGVKTEYTDPKAKEKEKKAEKQGARKSFFSGLFSFEKKEQKKPNIAPPDLPQGKPLPSAMFASLQNREASKEDHEHVEWKQEERKEINQEKKESIYAKSVMSMHAPDFLETTPRSRSNKTGGPSFALSTESGRAPKGMQEKKQAKISWWQRIFLRKKKIAPLDPIQTIQKISFAPAISAIKKPVQIPTQRVANLWLEKVQSKETTDAPVHRVSGFDVNLLSQEYSRAFSKINPVSILLTYVGLTLVFIGFLFSILYAYQVKSEQRISKIEKVSAALKQTIATYNEIEIQDSALRAKVDIVEKLLKKHVSWNEFLVKLEKETIPEVSYLNMAASLEGKMSISAFAKDYSSLARQITVFQNVPWIKDLSVTSASLVDETATLPGGVSFDMQITIDKESLYSKQ